MESLPSPRVILQTHAGVFRDTCSWDPEDWNRAVLMIKAKFQALPEKCTPFYPVPQIKLDGRDFIKFRLEFERLYNLIEDICTHANIQHPDRVIYKPSMGHREIYIFILPKN